MATLFDLCTKSIPDSTSDELQERLRNIRRNRRTPATPPVKEKKAKAMSPEEAAEMLKLLGVSND
jgi:hypothetical protein